MNGLKRHNINHISAKLKSIQGFSLTSVMVGLGLSVLVGGIVLDSMLSVNKMDQKNQLQTLLDSEHLSAVHVVSSTRMIREAILDTNVSLKACVENHGVSCEAFDNYTAAFPDLHSLNLNAQFSLHGICAVGGSCLVDRQVSYHVRGCGGAKCRIVETEVKTNFIGSSGDYGQMRSRSSLLRFPFFGLAAKASIDWSCSLATSNFMSGVDFLSRKGSCNPIDTSSNTVNCGASPKPLIRFGGVDTMVKYCQDFVSSTCPTGVSQVGLLDTQVICRP